ncbi:hypothetical protein LP420_16095 [Massilia sp. B-10]|nr:hypothetical protein LP420_16095 [Massilia sp. B-10]
MLPDGDAEATVTVADIYLRQNVQGRVAILARRGLHAAAGQAARGRAVRAALELSSASARRRSTICAGCWRTSPTPAP